MKVIVRYMGLLALALNLLTCSGGSASFKPGILSKAGYYIHKHRVYYYGGFGSATVTVLEHADAARFEILDKRFPKQQYAHLYGSDGANVYFEGKLIKGADGRSFEVFGYGWGKDRTHVFAYHSILSDDPAHYEDAQGGLFKDSKHVYDGDRVVSDDPGSLTYLGSSGLRSYHADAAGVMSGTIRIAGADPNTFKPLIHNYSSDASRVFLIDEGIVKVLADADPATFKVLSRYYAKDAKHVFWRNLKLPGADPASFVVLSEEHHRSRDGEQMYEREKVIQAVKQ